MLARSTVDEDPELREVLLSGKRAFNLLAGEEPWLRSTAGPASALNSLLAKPRTVVLFRTIRWADFAALQIARRGFVVATFQRYLIVEAPWLLISALVARVGLGTEVVNIRWEIGSGPWGAGLRGGATPGVEP
jgi:hypothetical protein